jgi:hypothetical protein
VTKPAAAQTFAEVRGEWERARERFETAVQQYLDEPAEHLADRIPTLLIQLEIRRRVLRRHGGRCP